jgi:hypothetical protein
MSTAFQDELDGQIGDSQRLLKLLERVAELQAEKDRIATEAKKVNKELDELESLAVEQLSLSGLDGVRAAGKSWGTRESFQVSIPAEFKERVLEVAQDECPELVAVNTASLKSWLMERRRETGGDAGLTAGTPFDGLVREYREVRLSHRSLG